MLTVKLTYFGVFQIEVNGQLVTNFRTEKTAALLAYLVLEGQTPISRDRITDLLWHGYQKKAAQTSLRVALTHLRQLLAPMQPIKATHKQIYFDSTGLSMGSDVAALTEVVSAQAQPFSAQQITQRLTLYRGEFLDGWELIDSAPFQEWLQQRRVYYQTMVANLRHRLTSLPHKVSRPYQHNLPRRPTPLFGHTANLIQLRTLLLDLQHPLITLTGEGGIGKTRLALAAAWSFVETSDAYNQLFADGLWFVPLSDLNATADLTDALVAAIGIACGISFTTTVPLTTQLISWLRTKALLLILDSFEQVIAASPWLNSILQAAPQVKILVTSRQRLNLQAAMVAPVQELAVPAPDLTVAELLTYPSVQLFVERGQRVRPNFRLQPGNAAAVAQICRKMAGLPLGIELAATLLLLYSAEQITAQLAVEALTVNAAWLDWPARHQSIAEVLNTSWRLLTSEEAALLARLAVIKGKFTLAEATTIGAAQPATLFALVDKSLLRQTVDEERFAMHDLVRDYAFHQLQQQPAQVAATHRRHAAYYLAMVAAEEAALPNTQTAQIRLMRQIDNIRAAWAWSVAQGEVALWAPASDGLIWFYRVVGFSQEAVTALQAAVTALRAHLATTACCAHYQPLLARLLVGVAEFSPYAEREPLLREALDWSERSGDADSRSLTYYEMATLYHIQGNFTTMLVCAQQAQHWAQQSEQPLRQLDSLHSLALAYYCHSDFTAVFAEINEIETKLKHTSNRYRESFILVYVGRFYIELEEYGKALHSLRRAFIGSWLVKPPHLHAVRIQLGKLYSVLGLFATAQMLYHQGLAFYEQGNNFFQQFHAQHGLGSHYYTTGNLPLALHHLRAAHQLTQQHNMLHFEHVVLVDLGYTLTSLNADQAATCFEQAIRLGEPKHRYSTVGRAYVGLAKLALRNNNKVLARRVIEKALTQWHQGRTDRAELRLFYWHCYEVLQALGDPRAQAVLHQGYLQLMQEADTLSDPYLRRSFLENVPINRALLTAAQAGKGSQFSAAGLKAQSGVQTESVSAPV